jgi:hypothetical protein
MADPGDGFGSKSTCENYCAGHGPTPGPGQDTYRCNTTIGICEKCKKGDTGCGPDRATECANCKPPPPDPTKKYKCDRTDPEQPKCNECKNSTSSNPDPDCQEKGKACQTCHPKQKLFECDPKTLTCVQAKQQGNIK